ncbi:MAG TPA: UDP-glucose 4-epimerase GalE [Phenylobacterium sp.]|nr:UDP-glucose 4-epimerase GalE [Phenylobacterium sp.]
MARGPMEGAGGGRGVILVTGGAGYIGSHACRALSDAGYAPVVFDDLSNGHEAFVRWGPLEIGDIRDRRALDAVFARHRPVGVMHFAGLIEVGESVLHPDRFHDVNVVGSRQVIEAARQAGVRAFVFSSTCATYGAPLAASMDESHPQAPLNPYGQGKLAVEQTLEELDRQSGFRSVRLRYFNAAGADAQGRIGERHAPETHAIPLAIMAALDPSRRFTIFGDDYPTADGTAVRDYVHVDDLAEAHLKALEWLLAGGGSEVFNLGSGSGTSMVELIAAIERVSGRPLNVGRGGRREGDASSLIADASKIGRVLGWRTTKDIDQIIRSAWAWHEAELARASRS